MNPRNISIALLILLVSCAWAVAQSEPEDMEMYKNGLLPTGTYAGPGTTVNLYNGNFIQSIPLFSLPGRGGHDLNLTLTYNSRQLVREKVGTQWEGRWFDEGPTVGRWTTNFWPSLRSEGTPGNMTYYLTTPDGAVHRLVDLGSGKYGSVDGTNIYYWESADYVALLNGYRMDFADYDSLNKIYHIDPNGNYITYEFDVYDRPIEIRDTLDREVTINYFTSGPSIGEIEEIRVKNHAGTDLVYSLDYTVKRVEPSVAEWINPIGLVHYYGCELDAVLNDYPLLSSITLPNSATYLMTYDENQFGGSTVQMETLTLPTGAVMTYVYDHPTIQNITDYDDPYFSYRLSQYVEEVEADPIGGGAFTTLYDYYFDIDGLVTSTTEIRADGSKHSVDFYPDTSANPYLREKESWTDTDGSTVLVEKEAAWTDTPVGTSLSSVLVRDVPANKSMKTERYLDDWGREAERKVYGFGAGSYPGVMETATYRYFNDPDYYYGISLLLREDQVLNSSTTTQGWTHDRLIASTEYSYDDFSLTNRGTVTGHDSFYGTGYTFRGNLTKLRRYLIDEDRWIETKIYYDTVGNAVESRDPNNAASYLEYSGTYHHAYPTKATNALGQYTQATYNFNTGLVTSQTNMNGASTTLTYETYNRPLRIDRPDGGYQDYAYADTFFSGNLRTRVRTRTKLRTGLPVLSQYDYSDGLGRGIRSQHQRENLDWVRVESEFAICSCTGRSSRTSIPRVVGDPSYWSETRYDGIGRVTKVIPPDGSDTSNFTEYKYGFKTMDGKVLRAVGVFDAKGIGKVYGYDASGRLRAVGEDANPSDLSWTHLTTYDIYPDSTYRNENFMRWDLYQAAYVDTSVRVADNGYFEINQGDQTRLFTKDSLGRTVQEEHPENGTTSYTFDDAGVMLTKTDARNVVTTLGYDLVNRPTSITYSDLTPSVTYTYDTGLYGIGRLYQVSNANATSTYTYDNMGRTLSHAKTIGGVAFSTSTTYEYGGMPETRTLPDGTEISYTYGRSGLMLSVTSDWVDANHPATLASNMAYNAAGQMTSVDYGNGTTSTRSFNTGLQLKTLQHGTSGDPGAFLDFEYDYDEGVSNTGQIMGITNYNDTTKSLDFTYDDYFRLSTAETTGSHWGLSWTYDRYGNRSDQTLTKGTGPADSVTVSTSTNRVNGWGYDDAGNTTNDSAYQYTYDANNMIKDVGAGTVVYKYDAAGQRVMKVTASETIYYVLGSGEFSSVSGWEKTWVFMGREKLVEYSDATTYFYHSDHLTTPRSKTNMSGTEVEAWSSYPYGEEWESSDPGDEEHRFTGYLQDDETGNHYARARYYGEGGRWLSVDPVLGRRSNPQRLNRFSYVLADPINYLDPGGTAACHQSKCGVGIAAIIGWPEAPSEEELEEETGSTWGPPMELAPPGQSNTGSGGSFDVNRSWEREMSCSLTATDLMQQVQTGFASFANYAGGSLSPLTTPRHTVSFHTDDPLQVGTRIEISHVVSTFNVPVLDIKSYVEVIEITSNSLVFRTDPTRHPFDGTISFRTQDTENGVRFGIDVRVNHSSENWQALFEYLGGASLENAIWNNLLDSVEDRCK